MISSSVLPALTIEFTDEPTFAASSPVTPIFSFSFAFPSTPRVSEAFASFCAALISPNPLNAFTTNTIAAILATTATNGNAIAPSAGSNIAIKGAIPATIAGINPANNDAIPPSAFSSNSSVFSSIFFNSAKSLSFVSVSLPEPLNFAVPAVATTVLVFPGVATAPVGPPNVAPVLPSMSVAPNMPDLGANAGFTAPLAVFSDIRFPVFEVLYLFPCSSVCTCKCAGVSLSRSAIFAFLAFLRAFPRTPRPGPPPISAFCFACARSRERTSSKLPGAFLSGVPIPNIPLKLAPIAVLAAFNELPPASFLDC